ncbi:MAG: hypothetical protein LC808_34840, partial [Actinobacteria bacterium]|nr:hypothetical protein [Actinomycetota bacterium]
DQPEPNERMSLMRKSNNNLRPTVGRRWLLVLAAALVLPGAVAGAAEPDPAAEVESADNLFRVLARRVGQLW